MQGIYRYFLPILILGLLAPAAAAQPRGFTLPPQAQEIVPGAYYLGRSKDRTGKIVDGIAFVHPRGAEAKGGRKPGGQGKESPCYSLLASGARWKSVENYFVGTDNADGLNKPAIEGDIALGLSLWEQAAGMAIFGGQIVGSVDGVDTTQPDDKNEFLFGPIDEPNVIAVTITWGIFSGPPFARELVEWDMVFNDADFLWGTADQDTGVMDFLNIFVHEAGHAAGLGHPSLTCTEETMYAYAEEDETKKRDLNPGDVAGIQALYK